MLTYAHTPQISQPNSRIFNLALKSHKERLERAQMTSTMLRKRERTSTNQGGGGSSIYSHPEKLAVMLVFYLADMSAVRRTSPRHVVQIQVRRTSPLSGGHVLLTVSSSHSKSFVHSMTSHPNPNEHFWLCRTTDVASPLIVRHTYTQDKIKYILPLLEFNLQPCRSLLS